jgi:uncharacterized protein involved in exopolysaccharide biosynthesis
MSQNAETVNLADVVRSVRRGWQAVLTYFILGIAVAIAVILLAPPRFKGEASVVLRSNESGLSRLAKIDDAIGGMVGNAAGIPAPRTPLETELQILESRALAEHVIDSLNLQVRVRSPRSVPAATVVERVNLPGSFRKAKLKVQRSGNDSLVVRGAGLDTTVAVGVPVRVLTGYIALGPAASLPPSMTLQLLDREDAAKRFDKRLSVSKEGGEVASVSFQADDSLTAAAVSNAVVAAYLKRRRTTDRGTNQHRVEFLERQIDSTSQKLAHAERELRLFQERTGVIDATLVAEVQLERLGELRKELSLAQVEENSMKELLRRVGDGTLTVRQLAAYPAFLKSASLNDLLSQISHLETARQQLLERRTDRDPEVVALTKSIENVEAQFLPLARSYASSMSEQRQGLTRELDDLRGELGVLPSAAESGGRLQRDVLRLGQVYAALQAQLVEARLAAIDEGGQVRQLDMAISPKKPSFPEPYSTLAIGGSAGLLCGVVAALVLAVFGRWARDPLEIERTTGVPTIQLDRRAPLVVAPALSRTLLVVPLHERADALAVARQIVETSLSRRTTATILDLVPATSHPAVASDASALDVNGAIDRLGTEFETVVVRLPSLTADATLAAMNAHRPVVLVVPPGRIERDQLVTAVQTLRRLEAPCAGIVVSGSEAPRRLHALAT